MNRRIIFENILVWGSLWGLEEATLGHLFHLIPFRIGWFFWFPLSFFFMHQVYQKTNRSGAVLCTALLAALVKLVDLALPTRLDIVLNPAAAILLEGCAVFVLFWMIEKKPKLASYPFLEVMGVSLLQGLLYLVYILIVPSFFPAIPPMKGGLKGCFESLWHCLMNGIPIFVYLKFYKNMANLLSIKACMARLDKIKQAVLCKRAAASCPYLLLVVSVYATWVL